jgi:hypothetical protein
MAPKLEDLQRGAPRKTSTVAPESPNPRARSEKEILQRAQSARQAGYDHPL